MNNIYINKKVNKRNWSKINYDPIHTNRGFVWY